MSHEVQKTSPLQYQLGDVCQTNIQQLKALNVATLPVKYSEKFYKELISNYSTEYLKYALWNGFVVGAVCARIENKETEFKKLYIMTINVLAPYRNRGIGFCLIVALCELYII
jgi:ribosomal protein S18 acetylase RimI-like enzyme